MDKRFKVLMLNGSPRENGNIAVGFREMQKIFEEREKAQAEYDAALKDILTKKQFKAYKKDREEFQEHRPGPRM